MCALSILPRVYVLMAGLSYMHKIYLTGRRHTSRETIYHHTFRYSDLHVLSPSSISVVALSSMLHIVTRWLELTRTIYSSGKVGVSEGCQYSRLQPMILSEDTHVGYIAYLERHFFTSSHMVSMQSPLSDFSSMQSSVSIRASSVIVKSVMDS